MENLQPSKALTKELRDQLGHSAHALCLFLSFIFPVPPLVAGLLVMVVAFLRELEQHNWEWRAVGRFDLLIYFIATSFFIVAWYLIT